MLKNIDQKLARHDPVHRDPCSLDLRKRSVTLDHDQRSCLYFSHLEGSACDLVYGLFRIPLLESGILGNKKICDDVFASELLQRFPEFRLEDNDESRQYELAHMVDDPGDRIQMEHRRQQIESDNDHTTPQQHSCSRRLYPQKDFIDQDCEDQNFKKIRQCDLRNKCKPGIHIPKKFCHFVTSVQLFTRFSFLASHVFS